MTTDLIRLWPGDKIRVAGIVYQSDRKWNLRIVRGPAYRKAHAEPKAGEKLAKLLDGAKRKPAKKKGAKK